MSQFLTEPSSPGEFDEKWEVVESYQEKHDYASADGSEVDNNLTKSSDYDGSSSGSYVEFTDISQNQNILEPTYCNITNKNDPDADIDDKKPTTDTKDQSPELTNFVWEYIKEYHSDYYLKLLNDREKYPEHYKATGLVTSNSGDSNSTTTVDKPKIEVPKEKSESEKEAERLAELCINHPKFNDTIKTRVEKEKLEEKNKNKDTNQGKFWINDDCYCTYDEDTQTVTLQNTSGEKKLSKFYGKNTPLPKNVKKGLINYLMIKEIAKSDDIEILRLSWKVFGEETTMFEEIIKENGGESLPRAHKLAVSADLSNVSKAVSIRKVWKAVHDLERFDA
tara:strand:+ start:993 stop:2000 length:1008 start_codon:yes stop_codon:yes gene_type:complete